MGGAVCEGQRGRKSKETGRCRAGKPDLRAWKPRNVPVNQVRAPQSDAVVVLSSLLASGLVTEGKDYRSQQASHLMCVAMAPKNVVF